MHPNAYTPPRIPITRPLLDILEPSPKLRLRSDLDVDLDISLRRCNIYELCLCIPPSLKYNCFFIECAVKLQRFGEKGLNPREIFSASLSFDVGIRLSADDTAVLKGDPTGWAGSREC
ncbi:hypothetical protein RSOLAG1IB_07480 [Rhizoctonia solani AG-1 IB]|uniref:Uncharacterized protein n=1 Tax=Thanatephorus cucumeris (strain AG1-IB / isolate 7/3/14) TaxID=1108050 RepID=A0A0B7FFL8_THACB|nr:hypothetical protein RSOLAG1IB_07480 [Rhizoctonia solani AG-1 IB]